jgi:hypothetical protein
MGAKRKRHIITSYRNMIIVQRYDFEQRPGAAGRNAVTFFETEDPEFGG